MINQIIKNVLSEYDLGEFVSVVRLTKGFSNQSYRLQTTTGIVLFRIFGPQNLTDVQYEIRLLNHLKKFNFPASFPLPKEDGSFISQTSKGIAAIFDFLEGDEPQRTPETVVEIGSAIAKFSLINSEGFEFPNRFGFEKIKKLIGRFKDAPIQYPKYFEQYIKGVKEVEPYMNVPLPTGIIHGDIFTDNTIFKGNKLTGIIDFEGACTGAFLIEIGVTINGFCFEKEVLNLQFVEILLTNYEKIRPLTQKEKELLPYYIKAGALAMAYFHFDDDLLNFKVERQLERVKLHLKRVENVNPEAVWAISL